MATTREPQPNFKEVYGKSDRCEKKAEYASRKWEQIKAHLEDNGLTTKSRLDMAVRYVHACTEYHFLYPEAVGEGPVKTGPNKGDVYNMKWGAVEKINDRILKFEENLMISPKSADGKITPKVKKKGAPAEKWLTDNAT